MDTRDIYKLVRELSEEKDDVINLYDSMDIELSEGFVIETGVVGFTEDGVIVHLDEDAMEFLDFNGVLLESEENLNEDEGTADAVCDAILNRIARQHSDVLQKFGPQAVMDAAEDLAQNYNDLDEIGSSDVSIWTKQVIQDLEAGQYAHLNENPALMALGRAAAMGAGSELAGRVADKIGLEEGGDSDVEQFKAKISTSDDPFELVYDAISGKHGEAIRAAMQDMYDDIVIDFRLHPDDDFEKIIDKMLDYLDADSVVKEGSDNVSEDFYSGIDTKFDARSTADYAQQISQAIQKVTGAPVSITPERGDPRDEGKYNLVVNPSTDNREVGYIVKDGNDGATVENISKAIDPFFRMFREKGWVFTQPFRGAFTIGVPAPDELAEIKRLAGQEEVDEGLGKALLGGAALIAALTGVNKMQADSMMKSEPQLVTLAQMRQEAFVQNDDEKVKELDDRIKKTMDHISVTGRPVMGIDGLPVDPRRPVGEAEYQGRKVQLNKPMQGDVAKSKVYVKKPNGKVVKVNFGDKTMRIKKSNPARRKSFRARHNCDNPGPKWKARYWSCRAW
jgi:hypothetical protein